MPSDIKPTPIALVVCDSIYQEPGGKQALVGLFNGIWAPAFPALHARLAVFASATGVRPDSHAKIEIVHSETDDVVMSAQGPFPDSVSPLTVVDLAFVLQNVRFVSPGTYYVRFWGNGHILLQRPFEARLLGGKQHDKN